jgi:hypothetical protein
MNASILKNPPRAGKTQSSASPKIDGCEPDRAVRLAEVRRALAGTAPTWATAIAALSKGGCA